MRKEKIIAIYFLLILGVMNATVITKTHSKYKMSEQYSVTYTNQLYQVSKDENLGLVYAKDRSTSSKLIFHFVLKPNDVGVVNREEDKYYIEIPDGCNLSVRNPSNVLSSVDNNKILTINGDVEIDTTCPVDSIKNGTKWTISMKIKEQIKEEQKFLYKSGVVDVLELPKEEVSRETLEVEDDGNVYEKLLDWLESFARTSYNSDDPAIAISAIKEYIKQYESNVFDNGIPGLSIKKDENKYVFTLEENFIGYAMTYQHYKNLEDPTKDQHMYFSTEDTSILKSTFEYYLKTYIYKSNLSNADFILRYLESKKFDIANFILTGLPENQEPISWVSKGQIILSTRLLTNAQNTFQSGTGALEIPTIEKEVQDEKEEVIPPIKEEEEKKPVDEMNPPIEEPPIEEEKKYLTFDTKEKMLKSFEEYMRNINTLDTSQTLSESLINKVIENEEIRNSIIKNNKEEIPKSFQDYFSILDEQYYIIHTSSDGQDANKIQITPLTIQEESLKELSFQNDIDNTLHIMLKLNEIKKEEESLEEIETEITEEEIEKVKNIVTILDEYFQENSIHEDNTFGITNTKIEKKEEELLLEYVIIKQ